jgi:Amt family ammonium transporter
MEALKAELMAKIDQTQSDLDTKINNNAQDVNMGWLVICGALVFFMQAGFGMLEAGAIARKNVTNILFKNMLDASGAAICYWLLGYGFAYGTTENGFIGKDNFGIEQVFNGAGGGGSNADGWVSWFFQWAFTGAAATIVAGSVAERCKIEAYFVYSVFISTFIYPIVVHWVWGQGYLSAWGARPDENGNARPIIRLNEESNGVIDFAGSGVVHAVGGFSGLMGALALGPRKGRFDPVTGQVNPMPPHNVALMALGTAILWFGWYGFNCGSTLVLAGAGNLASKVAVNTTISAASACITGAFLTKLVEGHWDIGLTLNAILAGLVGVTASCAVINPWMAFIIGLSSAIIYLLASKLLLKLKIDDPLDACPIHGFCGIWGLLCVGIFCTDANVQYAGYPNVNDACGRGEQFGVQIIGAICIIGWTIVTAGIVFFGIKYTMGMRVSEEVEELGMDLSEHGGDAYADRSEKPVLAPQPMAMPPPAPAAGQPAPIYGAPIPANFPPQGYPGASPHMGYPPMGF